MKKKIFIFIAIAILICNFANAETIKYTVIANGLNIRENPNTECKILGTAKCGDILYGNQSVNGWTSVIWNNKTAFVFSKYITKVQENDSYTQSDLDLLSRVVFSEAGSDWISNEHQRAVASVVLNRVSDKRFPNSIKEVVYQKGQYGCVNNGMIKNTPNKRAIENAKYVLENGITIPQNVVWQSQFRQGKGVWKYIEGHYFCY